MIDQFPFNNGSLTMKDPYFYNLYLLVEKDLKSFVSDLPARCRRRVRGYGRVTDYSSPPDSLPLSSDLYIQRMGGGNAVVFQSVLNQ